MSFDPKKTDVDQHIDLINTLGDMVDQKEEAKMEKFIETMPTMIQTHLIIFRGFTQRSRGQTPQYNQRQFQNYRPQRGTSQYNHN